MNIGEAAAAAGLSPRMVRHYEKIGLTPKALRRDSQYRDYSTNDVHRLRFIARARDLGFPLEAIRELLTLSDDPQGACAMADDIARRQLAAVEARITRLTALKTEFERMLAHRPSGSAAECRVIRVLSDHGLCSHDHAREDAAP